MSNPHIETIMKTLASLAEGEPLPPACSEAFDRLTVALNAFLKHGTDADRAELGALAVGLVIDKGRAAIGAEQVLRSVGGPAA